MNMDELMQRIDDFTAKKGQLEAELREHGEAALGDAYGQFWHPKLLGFRWTQYTPYFNDGDSCEFEVNDLEIIGIRGHDEFEYYEGGFSLDGESLSRWTNSTLRAAASKDPTIIPALKGVSALHHRLDDHIHQCAFGDHAQVTIRFGEEPQSFTVEIDGYDHD